MSGSFDDVKSFGFVGGISGSRPLPWEMAPSEQTRPRRFERAPWRRPRGTHEVADYLFRHHFDEVVAKLGRHPDTRGTSQAYRENLASEVLKRMLESQKVEHFGDGTVGLWLRLALYRHVNESELAATRLSVTEDELFQESGGRQLSPEVRALGLDGFAGSSALEPDEVLVARERELAALELRAQMTEELQQLFQLRWEQGLKPQEIRQHFGWSSKQYEKRDEKLKALVLAAVKRSAPDTLVDGLGDGSACRRTREMLPLVFRDGGVLRGAARARFDTHLSTCPACTVAARQARRLVAETRPSFIPVGAPVGGGLVAGGGVVADLSAKIAALLGAGGAATKVAGVAGCAVLCVAGGTALLKEPAEAPPPRSTTFAAPSPPAVETAQRPANATTTAARSTPPKSAARTKRKPERKRTKPAAPPPHPSASPQTSRSAGSEFLPEAPSASAAPPARGPSPGIQSSGDEFAGP